MCARTTSDSALCILRRADAQARAQKIVLNVMRFLTGELCSSENWTELTLKPVAGWPLLAPPRSSLRQVQEQSQRRPEEEQAEIKQGSSYRCIVLAVS